MLAWPRGQINNLNILKLVECFLGLRSCSNSCEIVQSTLKLSFSSSANSGEDLRDASSSSGRQNPLFVHEDNQSNASLCHFFARKSDNGGLPRICKAQFGRRYCCVTSDSNIFFPLFSSTSLPPRHLSSPTSQNVQCFAVFQDF